MLGEKNKTKQKVHLKCPSLVFMANGELSRLAGWASLGRDEMVEYSDAPFLFQGSHKKGAGRATVEPCRACCEQNSCPNSSLPQAEGDFTSS